MCVFTKLVNSSEYKVGYAHNLVKRLNWFANFFFKQKGLFMSNLNFLSFYSDLKFDMPCLWALILSATDGMDKQIMIAQVEFRIMLQEP